MQTPEQITQYLTTTSLVAPDDLAAIRQSLGDKSDDPESLLRELVHQKKLTRFQAQLIDFGKTKGLIPGNCVILDRIGQGGMGQVYKARHRRMERVVALKVLPAAEVKKPGAVERSLEAQQAPKLAVNFGRGGR